MAGNPVCAMWFPREGDSLLGYDTDNRRWCATYKRTTQYQDSIKTLCGHIILFTGGIERRQPTCKECLEKLKRRRKR